MSLSRVAQSAPFLAAFCLVGCQEPASLHRYESVSGRVSSINIDSGEIEIASDAGHTQRAGTVRCMWTKDTEAYINGRFSPLANIVPGDSIRVLGYYDGGLNLPRLVATEIRVQRPVPPPPLPFFLTTLADHKEKSSP